MREIRKQKSQWLLGPPDVAGSAVAHRRREPLLRPIATILYYTILYYTILYYTML